MTLGKPRSATFALVLVLSAHCALAQAGTVADTLNRTDDTGRKQGWWQVQAPVANKPEYQAGQLVEEGSYTDNKRVGTWKRYWPNGKALSEINYVLGRPKGAYKMWYEDGTPEEEGAWDLNRNTGAFKRWHPNGQLAQDFVFDSNGLRNGDQKYYRENGNLEVEVAIQQGKEEGELKRYHANGDLAETAEFNDGVADAGSFKSYAPKRKVVELPALKEAVPAPAKTAQEAPNGTLFKAEGWNTLYDMQHRLAQQGEYRGGRLWQGKVYRYDKNGILTGVEVYVNGRYAGKAQLTHDDK